MSKNPALQVVTANDLLDGDVVFLAANGRWQRMLEGAAVADTAEEAARLLAIAEPQESLVVSPYLAEVARDATGRLEPVHYRERIRTLGPSNRPDLGRQAEGSKEPAHVSL